MSEKPTSIRLPSDIRTALRAACAKQGCAMNFKINQILREWVESKRESK